MLMQNFKTAPDLGITEPQKEALMKTLVLLETGKLEYQPKDRRILSFDENPTFCGYFNMKDWCASYDCGTVACIGGTAELIGGVIFTDPTDGLRQLFMPTALPVGEWGDITTAQAATALRSFLTTGDARWDLAVQS